MQQKEGVQSLWSQQHQWLQLGIYMRCPVYPIQFLSAYWSQIPHNPVLDSHESSSWYQSSNQIPEDPWLNLGTWWWRMHLSWRRNLRRWVLQQGNEKRQTSWPIWRKNPWLLSTLRWVWERTVNNTRWTNKITQLTKLCSCSRSIVVVLILQHILYIIKYNDNILAIFIEFCLEIFLKVLCFFQYRDYFICTATLSV